MTKGFENTLSPAWLIVFPMKSTLSATSSKYITQPSQVSTADIRLFQVAAPPEQPPMPDTVPSVLMIAFEMSTKLLT
jgi:hypothetical protein